MPNLLSFSVSFNDPGGAYAAYYQPISAAINAAGAIWAQQLNATKVASIDISVSFDNQATASGGSASYPVLGVRSGRQINEAGAMYELLTGTDPNGANADATIAFGTGYLANSLWFDPDPNARTAAIPAGKTDAVSVMLHELGHIFGFNGYVNSTTGVAPAGYASTFDRYVILGDDNTEYFTGPNAERVYGGPVPLTYGDYGHVGNQAPRAGVDLLSDLMDGVYFYTGTRYLPSALDVAILKDTEAPLTTDSVLTPLPDGIYRFFDKLHGTQFLTADATEKDNVLATRRDLVYEGVSLLAVDPAANDRNAAPVFRFFDTVYGTHFLTASTVERDTLLKTRSDLTFEGVGFNAHATAQPGDNAVYRFFDTHFGTHFYTADANERATILATRPDLTPEGIGFYAAAA